MHLEKEWLGGLCADIVEAARTGSYLETIGNKADTLHRHVSFLDEITIKRSYELQIRSCLKKLNLKKIELSIDGKKDLYYGKDKINTRGIKSEKGTSQAWEYIVISIVKPIKLPLMAVRYSQGLDLTNCCIELLEFVKSLPVKIKAIYFDRGFYIAKLIDYLENKNGKNPLPYLIFVPENYKIKKYIEKTKSLGVFKHEFRYACKKSIYKPKTTIVVCKNAGVNKVGKVYNMVFATNLKPSFSLVKEYKKRWNIETGFRIMEEGKIKTKSNNPLIRLFYFLLRCLLHSTWSFSNVKKIYFVFKKYLRIIEYNLRGFFGKKPPPILPIW